MMAPVPGGPAFISVSPFEFTPYMAPSFPGVMPNYSQQAIFNPGSSGHWFDAPLFLPKGATVTKLVAYYYDNSTSDMSAYLMVCPLDNQGCNTMANVGSSGAVDASRTSEDTTINFALIDTSLYSYMIEMSLGPGVALRVRGLRIDYAYNSALPVIVK
jgi:hypothetical protein